MIVIVDYGMGNLGSIVNMFKKIGSKAVVSSDVNDIEASSKLLLPGVGSFDRAMERINEMGLKPLLDKQVLKEKKPILGICLGMQLLTRGSEEGKLPGLGWIPADTVRFPNEPGLRIPHMGWNRVFQKNTSKISYKLTDESRFYFVHSYHVKVDNEKNSIYKCDYGITFDAAVQKDNIYGAQFHPEKSHRYGMQFFKNFVEL